MLHCLNWCGLFDSLQESFAAELGSVWPGIQPFALALGEENIDPVPALFLVPDPIELL
jgi:hypothetical protein